MLLFRGLTENEKKEDKIKKPKDRDTTFGLVKSHCTSGSSRDFGIVSTTKSVQIGKNYSKNSGHIAIISKDEEEVIDVSTFYKFKKSSGFLISPSSSYFDYDELKYTNRDFFSYLDQEVLLDRDSFPLKHINLKNDIGLIEKYIGFENEAFRKTAYNFSLFQSIIKDHLPYLDSFESKEKLNKNIESLRISYILNLYTDPKLWLLNEGLNWNDYALNEADKFIKRLNELKEIQDLRQYKENVEKYVNDYGNEIVL